MARTTAVMVHSPLRLSRCLPHVGDIGSYEPFGGEVSPGRKCPITSSVSDCTAVRAAPCRESVRSPAGRESVEVTRRMKPTNPVYTGLPTTIFEVMSRLAIEARRDQPRPGFPGCRRPRRRQAGRGGGARPGPQPVSADDGPGRAAPGGGRSQPALLRPRHRLADARCWSPPAPPRRCPTAWPG